MKAIGKVLLIGMILIATSFVVLSAPVHAASQTATSVSVVASSFGMSSHPKGSTLVMNIVYTVIDDEDSGFSGYWAMDNYTKHVKVWLEPNGTYYATAQYEGQWTTYTGALSPENGAPEILASGTFHGGYSMYITGTLSTGLKMFGYIGSYNFSGTRSDIILGTYGAGQTGDATPYNWLSAYFEPGFSYSMPSWGWTYIYESQTWINSISGSSGDIKT